MVFRIPHDLAISVAVDAGHRISGHLYEQIEYFYYFYFLKHWDCCIVSDDAELYIDEALKKYDFTTEEEAIIKSRIYSYPKNTKIIDCHNILFVDGCSNYRNQLFIRGNVFYFRCSWNVFRKGTIFQDNRLYDERPDSIHYVKKILFDKLKKPKESRDYKLLYLTKNCRRLPEKEFNEILKKYDDNRRFLVISDQYEKYFGVPEVIYEQVPVGKLFEKFSTYIYTPLHYHEMMDCSPRFIPECKYFGKEIIYDAPIYHGLNVRKYDTENNFESLFLTKEDPLDELIRYCQVSS